MFDATFFMANRQKLYHSLGPGLIVLAANGLMQRSVDQPYKLQQEPNFLYLTGIDRADWLFIANTKTGDEWLVAPHLLKYQEIFDGSLAPDAATRISGIKTILSAKAGRELLKQQLATKPKVYALKPMPRRLYGFYTNRAQHDLWLKLKGAQPQDIRLPLARQRAIKQPAEIKALRQAITITIDSILAATKQLPQMHYENEFEALITFEFRRRGARHGFDPIVASGNDASQVHYQANNSPLRPPFLLFDLGAQVENYSADLARAIPIGEPTKRQLEVLEAIERVRHNTLDMLKVGASVRTYLESFEAFMRTELRALGLIDGKDTSRETIYTWMPHAITHGLGLDIHDPLGRPETFAADMVVTVEPGIYIPKENIGIRLEDDIHITPQGPVVLSDRLPLRLF